MIQDLVYNECVLKAARLRGSLVLLGNSRKKVSNPIISVLLQYHEKSQSTSQEPNKNWRSLMLMIRQAGFQGVKTERVGALAGIWTRVLRATAAYTRPNYTTRAIYLA